VSIFFRHPMVQGKLKLNANKRSKVNHKNPGAKTRKGAPPKGQTKYSYCAVTDAAA